jgi:hypothetical protein
MEINYQEHYHQVDEGNHSNSERPSEGEEGLDAEMTSDERPRPIKES